MSSPSSATARVRVLGAGAGGGSPQWNCNCGVCRRVRRGEAPRRTQTSIAVSADGRRWVVINASPDLREQIADSPDLQPQRQGRHSPIEAVAVTGGEVDQVTGLLTLREGEAFSLYATASIHETLGRSEIFDVLDESLVPRRRFSLDEPVSVCDADGESLGVTIEPFSVPGKIPLYQETPGQTPELGATTDDNIAMRIDVGDRRLFFVPGCAQITPELKRRVDGSSLLLFDGTVWHDEELIDAGLGDKTGGRMGHVSISGAGGVLEEFGSVDIDRKVLIHINNSNPVLLDDTDQRRAVEAAGWEVAFDGMEL